MNGHNVALNIIHIMAALVNEQHTARKFIVSVFAENVDQNCIISYVMKCKVLQFYVYNSKKFNICILI